jgi:hypothetical protein
MHGTFLASAEITKRAGVHGATAEAFGRQVADRRLDPVTM